MRQLCAFGLALCLFLFACDREKKDSDENQRSSLGKVETATPRQPPAEGDRELMQKIRQTLIDDYGLSVDAKNIKVISKGHHVILKGPVDSDQEKKAVAEKVAHVKGVKSLELDLEVIR